jgi:multicomponent Na+:H+ antiporter subunit D
VGTPPLSGFVSKFNLLTAAGEAGAIGVVAIAALIISAILTAIYLFTVIGPMYFRPLNADMAHLADFNRDPNWMMLAPFALLMAMVIGLGLWGGPLVSFLKDVAAGVTF